MELVDKAPDLGGLVDRWLNGLLDGWSAGQTLCHLARLMAGQNTCQWVGCVVGQLDSWPADWSADQVGWLVR